MCKHVEGLIDRCLHSLDEEFLLFGSEWMDIFGATFLKYSLYDCV